MYCPAKYGKSNYKLRNKPRQPIKFESWPRETTTETSPTNPPPTLESPEPCTTSPEPAPEAAPNLYLIWAETP